jgi:hypothetical protein
LGLRPHKKEPGIHKKVLSLGYHADHNLIARLFISGSEIAEFKKTKGYAFQLVPPFSNRSMEVGPFLLAERAVSIHVLETERYLPHCPNHK